MDNRLLQIKSDSKSQGWDYNEWVLNEQDERALLEGYRPSVQKADHVCTFFEKYLQHSKGDFAKKPFILLEWQINSLRPIFGWLRPDGTRRFRKAGIWIAKKNGKTTTGAGLTIYMLLADGEAGAECYSAAADKSQAAITFREAANMITSSQQLSKRLKITKTTKTITYFKANSFYKALSADVPTKEGLNISFLLFDELHAQKTRLLYDTLVYGGVARSQPLMISISTAGDNLETIGYEQYQYAKSVADGSFTDIHFFPYVAEAPKEDDWGLQTTWEKANPSLGATINVDQFEADYQEARNSPSKENTFRRYRLNQWVQQKEKWLSLDKWLACYDDTSLESFEGCECFAGLDLASKIDTTAFTLVFRKDRHYYIYCWFWVPEERSIERNKSEDTPYLQWKREGWLETTPGNTTDYQYVRAKIKQLGKRFKIKEIGFDSWNANQLAIQLQDEDRFIMVECRQGGKTFNEPSKEFESLIISNQIHHNGNPILQWNVGNVSIRTDPNENIMPCKKTSGGKIDGVISTIMALSRWMVQPKQVRAYKDRGVIFV